MNTHDIDLATEIWAAAQKGPGEGIEDAIERIALIIEADRKRIKAMDNVVRPSRSVNQLKEALEDRSQRFTASYSEVKNLIEFYEADRKQVSDLISKYQEKIRALEADNHTLVAEIDELKRRGEPVELQGVAEAISNGDGFWHSCTGCHETNEGYATGPYSKTLRCHLGNGCRECGGIGAVWDDTDYDSLADFMEQSMDAAIDDGRKEQL